MMLDGRIIRDGKQVYSSTVLNDIVIHIGVSIIIFESGLATGPPADKLYAVEPVGVDKIMPSA